MAQKRLRWRAPVDPQTGLYEKWLNDLRGQGLSGVYLIRYTEDKRVLYVGESHTGRLYGTLTRHLYAWNGLGSGPSYHPLHVEVAVLIADNPLADPVADQFAYIQKFRPRDNVQDGHTVWWRMVTRRRKALAA